MVKVEPETMKAAILVEQHVPLMVDGVKLPGTLCFGQVLVKVMYSSICGSQLGEIDGVKGEDGYLPHLLGHEGSGVVIDIGQGVKTVKKGDHVVMHWKEGSGITSEPPMYSWKGKPLNAGWVTTFNEYAVVSENRVTAIDSSFPMELAPLLGCAVTTGFGIINNDAQVKIGESVVVLGAGGVGLSVIQGACLVSAHPVVAVDLYDNKLELAAKLGATHCINAAHGGDPYQLALDIVGENGADVVVENTGQTEMIELAYRLSACQGRSVLVGVPAQGKKASIFTLPLHFGKILTGSHGGDAMPHIDIPRYVDLYHAGKLNFEDLITDRFKLVGINDAIEKMRAGKISGRCLISVK